MLLRFQTLQAVEILQALVEELVFWSQVTRRDIEHVLLCEGFQRKTQQHQLELVIKQPNKRAVHAAGVRMVRERTPFQVVKQSGSRPAYRTTQTPSLI